MKIQPLYDLQQEINRLFIAGSKFAHSDPRLLKFVPVFEKMGEKAPVFKKAAADIQALAASDARESGDRLMALGALLYSILYTQGEALEEGAEKSEQQPLFSPDAVNTDRSYAQLKVLRDIAKGGSGRMELMQNAHETGVFKDFRSLRHLDAALEDKYSELADYVEKTVIPAAGKSMIPFLLRAFRYEDTSAQARRLRCLVNLDAPALPEITGKVFEESLPGLQVAAMGHLGKDPSNEDFLRGLTKDKNKKVREAAYEAVAAIGSAGGLEFLTDLYVKSKSKKNLGALAAALGWFSRDDTIGALLDAANQSCDDIAELCRQPKIDKKDAEAKGQLLMDSMETLNNKKRPEVIEFLSRLAADEKAFGLMADRGAGGYSYRFPGLFLSVLRNMGESAEFAFYEAHCRDGKADKWPLLWGAYLTLAAKRYSPQDLHTEFCLAAASDLLSLRYVLNAVEHKPVHPEGSLAPRYDAGILTDLWAEVLYRCYMRKHDQPDEAHCALLLLHSLEPMDSTRFAKFLAQQAKKDLTLRIAQAVFSLMTDRGVKGADEAVYNYIARYNDRNGYYLYTMFKPLYMRLPREYALKLKKQNDRNRSHYLTHIVREMLGDMLGDMPG